MKQIPRGTTHYPISVRLTEEQIARLIEMCEQSGLSQSMVIRHLIDQATLRPAIIRTEAPATNGHSLQPTK